MLMILFIVLERRVGVCVKDRWQFQKAILKRDKVQDMPKKDWVVLKQENIESMKNQALCNYQYICYSTEEVLEALHSGRDILFSLDLDSWDEKLEMY